MESTFFIEKLLSFYKEKKALNARYSLRAFARDLNIHSSTLSHVLQNKRKLPSQVAQQIAKKINLTPEEQILFIKSMKSNNFQDDNYIMKIHYSELFFKIFNDHDYWLVFLNLRRNNTINIKKLSSKIKISPAKLKNILMEFHSHQLISFDPAGEQLKPIFKL